MSFTTERWGDVYLAAAGRGISVCGDFLAATTLALVLQQAGHSGWAVSGLMLAAGLPLALFAAPAGRLADRADSRTLLVVVGFAQAAVCLALAFATHPVLIIALVAMLACGLAVTQPTLSALLPQMVRRENLAKASGINQTAGLLGSLAAPALAGVLVGEVGARLPLLLDAGSYLALVAVGLLLRTRRHGGAAAAAADRSAFRLRDDRVLTVMTGALAAVVAGISAINVIEVFFVRETLGASTTVYGIVTAAWAGGMLIGVLGFARIAPGRLTVRVVLAMLAGSCLPVLLGATVDSATWLIPLWMLGGVCNGGLNVCTTVIVAGRVPPAMHGRAFSVLAAAANGAGMAGLFAAGPLVEHFEPRPLVALAGGLGLLAALACLPLVRREPPAPVPGERDAVPDDVTAGAR